MWNRIPVPKSKSRKRTGTEHVLYQNSSPTATEATKVLTDTSHEYRDRHNKHKLSIADFILGENETTALQELGNEHICTK